VFSDTTSNDLTGFVFKKTLGTYFVNVSGRTVVCSISNKLRKQLVYPIADPSSLRPHVMEVKEIEAIDPVAIGDNVRFVDGGNETGMITEVLPRRNKLARTSAGKKQLEQVMVANADQIVTVFAAERPEPKWNLLDRYLVSAEAAGIPALICMTKLDLADEERYADELQTYRDMGYPIALTSSVSGRGIPQFREMLAGKVSILMGKSGVGKTTLLNAVQPGLGLRVGEVSRESGKGKHTTTHLEMIPLDEGGGVVDTPGMREFAFWNVDAGDIALLFRDLQPYVGECRFGVDCNHEHEPGCAIKAAVERGDVSERRYRSYLHLQHE
jgi:ribosome biogenesis GTPase / thiamine phosphate phosphatase